MSNFYNDTEKALIRLDEKTTLILATLKLNNTLKPDDVFFDNQEFLQVMNISKRTAQTWRDEGKISFSQIGSKIYYRMSDVQKLLDKNYKQAFSNKKRNY